MVERGRGNSSGNNSGNNSGNSSGNGSGSSGNARGGGKQSGKSTPSSGRSSTPSGGRSSTGSTGRSTGAGGRGKKPEADPPFSRARGERPPRNTTNRTTDRTAAGSDRGSDRARPRARDEATRNAEQARYDGPPLDEAITGQELDRTITQHFRGLPEKLANRVARHLVAAGLLLDTDPETAYQHTLAARARAARIAVVREACGEAAYTAGHYTEALSELRAAKRINGNQEYLPVMADCERALGRPDRALTLAHNPAVTNLPPDLKAEMTIVEAGARRDLGELDAALRTLENAPLRTQSRENWVVRLRYTYADTLHHAGRTPEAIEWFHRTIAIDNDHTTNATQRIEQLEHLPQD